MRQKIQPQTAEPTTVKVKPLIDRSPVVIQNWTDFFIFNNPLDSIVCKICKVQFKLRTNALTHGPFSGGLPSSGHREF